MQIFNCMSVGTSNPCVVQQPIVFMSSLSFSQSYSCSAFLFFLICVYFGLPQVSLRSYHFSTIFNLSLSFLSFSLSCIPLSLKTLSKYLSLDQHLIFTRNATLVFYSIFSFLSHLAFFKELSTLYLSPTIHMSALRNLDSIPPIFWDCFYLKSLKT